MQTSLRHALLGVSLLLSVGSAAAAAKTLNVPLTVQEHSQWCWAGSSQAVLGLYQRNPSQCAIVNWAFGINYACGNSNFNWNSYANQPNSMFGSNGSLQHILSNWGVPSTTVYNYLAWNNVVSDIQANRPFVLRYGWTNGGGHFLVGRGFDNNNGNYLYLMNPWPGEGMSYVAYNYAVAAADHNWTHTLRMNVSP